MLQDSCPCIDGGVRQGWVTVNGSWRCQSCCGDLGRIVHDPVPVELRASLNLIAGIVDPDPAVRSVSLQILPPGLHQTDCTLIYDLIMNLTRVLENQAEGLHPQVERTEAMAHACAAVLQWPDGLQTFGRKSGNTPQVGDWARRTYAVLDAVTDSRPSATPSSSPKAISTDAHSIGALAYVPRGAGGRLRTDLIGAMAAARLCGIDETCLKRAWDEGMFTQHAWVMGSRRVRAWDPAEVVRRAPLLRVGEGRARVGRMLGLPIYGVEQLLAGGTLAPNPPSSAVKQTEAHEAAARALTAELSRMQSRFADPVGLVEAMRHVSGRMKPWGAAIAAMLDRSIPFRIVAGTLKSSLLQRVVVPADSIPSICALDESQSPQVVVERSSRWSQSDALECLNGNRKEPPNLLQGLTVVGRSPKTFAVSDILERARAGVTTADLARQHGRSIARTALILAGEGVPQIAPGLWARKRAELVSLRSDALRSPPPCA